MISAKEISHLWGKDGIIFLPYDILSNESIPETAKVFLSEFGLPRSAELYVTFDISERGLQTLSNFAQAEGLQIPVQGKNFYRIGSDSVMQICMKMGSGEINAIDLYGKYPERFINTTIQQFIECLKLFKFHAQHIQGLSDKEIDRTLPGFEESILEIDMKALADCENWWSVIIEQMHDGLL